MRVPVWLTVNGQKDITQILGEKTKEVIKNFGLDSGIVSIDNCMLQNGNKSFQFEGKAIVPFKKDGIYLQKDYKVIYDRSNLEQHDILLKIVGDSYDIIS